MIINNLLTGIVKDKIQRLKPTTKNTLPKAALIINAGTTQTINHAIAKKINHTGMRVYITENSDCAEKHKQRTNNVSKDTGDNINTGNIDTGNNIIPIAIDLHNKQHIVQAFDTIVNDGYAIDLVIFTPSTIPSTAFLDITPDNIEHHWRAHCLAGFYIGQQAIAHMIDNGGCILFTGSPSSLQGNAGFTELSSAAAGLRILAQSMAREFSPKGIHVAHIILDNVSDGTKDNTAHNDIANTYLSIYQQHPSTWTHEVDLHTAYSVSG